MEILRKSSPPVGLFGRRGFLTGAGATLLYAALAPHRRLARGVGAAPGRRPVHARGRVGRSHPDGVVLWTRLAPKPLEGGGMPDHPIAVQWRIATDERMGRVVQRGAVLAVPELGHSVHVEVEGLEPARWYWYQFKVGNEVQPDRPHAHRAAPLDRRGAELRLRLLSALRERPLLRPPAPGRGEPRLRGAPGRLHLRRGPPPARSAARICPTTRSRRSRTIASATRSTSPIRTCRPCTRRSRGS